MRPSRLAAAAAALSLVATAAQAHARLKSADPAAGSTVAARAKLTLTFSEALVGRFSGLELAGPAGAVPVKTSVAGAVLTGVVAAPLASGAYTVKWRAVASDTHRTQGSYGFSVK